MWNSAQFLVNAKMQTNNELQQNHSFRKQRRAAWKWLNALFIIIKPYGLHMTYDTDSPVGYFHAVATNKTFCDAGVREHNKKRKRWLFQINQEVDDYVERVTGLNSIADVGLGGRGSK